MAAAGSPVAGAMAGIRWLDRSRLACVALIVLLSALGYLGNMLVVPLYNGVHLLFGSVATMLAARWLGVLPTLVVALAASSYTLVLWHHPYAMLIFGAEALVVASLFRRWDIDTLLADALYWLLLGAPLALLTYRYGLGASADAAGLVAAKQAANALSNTLIANLIWLGVGRLPRRHPGLGYRIAFAPLLLNLLVAFTLLPGLLLVGREGRESQRDMLADIDLALEGRAALLRQRFMTVREDAAGMLHGQLVDAVLAQQQPASAHEVVASMPRPSQGARLWVRGPAGDVAAVLGAPPARDGAPATWPRRNRPAPGQLLTSTALVYRGETWQARLERPWEQLGWLRDASADDDAGFVQALLDGDGKCLVSASPWVCDRYLDGLRGNGYTLASTGHGMRVLTPMTPGLNAMSRAERALYLRVEPLGEGSPEQLLVGLPAGDAVAQQRQGYLRGLETLLGVVAVALLLGWALSQRLTVMLRRLSRALEDLGPALMQGNAPASALDWPHSGLVELDRLTGHVRAMGDALAKSLQEGQRQGEALRVLAERLQVANRGAGIGVWDWHVDSGELIFDEQMFEVLGVDAGVVPSYAVWRAQLVPEDRAPTESELQRCMACEDTFKAEFRIRHPRLGLRFVVGYAVIFRNQTGRATRLVGLNWDVTDQRLLQAELIQSSKMATLGQMATAVAHELNQPLNVIGFAVGNLRRRVLSSQAETKDLRAYLAEKLDTLDAQVKRAAQIIDHMRIFGRRSDSAPCPVELETVARSTMQMMRQQMRQHGIALELEAGEDLPPVRGDAVQLEQVLLNLLGNARDALLARDPADKWIRLRVQQGAALTVEIVVEDNAGGIDADPIERVFEPFFTTKPPGKGTGLGLSVSYGIVDALDGQMRVENTRVGARFTVRLPVWAGEEPTDRREAQRATPP